MKHEEYDNLPKLRVDNCPQDSESRFTLLIRLQNMVLVAFVSYHAVLCQDQCLGNLITAFLYLHSMLFAYLASHPSSFWQ